MDDLLRGLRASAEPTRLRVLALCNRAELTVSDLTQILGQSQPRVSRHLKNLVEAGLLERFREGQWAFYRLAESAPTAPLARQVVALIPADEPTIVQDQRRLEAVKAARAEAAEAYFRKNARQWDQIRRFYVDDAEVEAALRRLVPESEVGDLLDIGTGTGRMIEVFADRYTRAVGIDRSHEMLTVARHRLDRGDLRAWQVRQGDMTALPVPDTTYDTATLHMVLHYADNPREVLAEAARALRPGGRIVVVDFAPHELEELRTEHAHRRLGFADAEMTRWFAAAGLEPAQTEHLPGERLTICLWCARKPAAAAPSGDPTGAKDAEHRKRGYAA